MDKPVRDRLVPDPAAFRDEAEDGPGRPVPRVTCPVCAALVSRPDIEAHGLWHRRLVSLTGHDRDRFRRVTEPAEEGGS